jgi:hypothetical protein
MTSPPPPPLVIVFLDIDGVLLPIVGNDCGRDDGEGQEDDDSAAGDDRSSSSLRPLKGRLFPQQPIDALSVLCARVPTIQLVLSSTWRVHVAWRYDILNELQTYGSGPLSQLTQFHDVTDPAMHGERQHEIYQWLATHHTTGGGIDVSSGGSSIGVRSAAAPAATAVGTTTPAAWIALDDEDLLDGPANAAHRALFERHVIHCDSKVGLTMEQAEEAADLLQAQLQQQRQLLSPPSRSSGRRHHRDRVTAKMTT